MKNKSVYYYDSPLGRILIREAYGAITQLCFFDEVNGEVNCILNGDDASFRETALLAEAGGQLKEYFDGKRKVFDLPIAPRGTVFQTKVWETLQKIPYGRTRSYGEIARIIGHEKAYRAVGMANNKNPISIIIPCHRVIGSDGKPVGYGGGLDRKIYLLKLEKKWA